MTSSAPIAAIERFSNSRNDNGLGFSNGVVADENGHYVRHSDYQELLRKAEAMKREMAEKDERIAELRRMAADRAYMMQAYRNMLGPKALDVAEMWDRKGVFRQHTTWGPEAIALTGEERAQVLLDVESAISSPIDDLDSELPTPQEPAARARTLIQGEKNAE